MEVFCFVLFCFVFILVPLACSVSARKSSQSLVVAPLYYNILWQNPIFCFFLPNQYETAFQVAQWQRICLPVQEMWVRSLVWEDPLEEEMATHSSILAWRILWTEEPGGLQSMGHKSQTWLCDLNNNNNIQEVVFLLLFLRFSNFWHFNYSVSWCGSVWVHLVWVFLGFLNLMSSLFLRLGNLSAQYFFK